MHPAHASHIPSCDPIPPQERRRYRAWWAPLAAVLLLPAPALAQEMRAKDLSVIEDLLADSVQEAIELTVREVNTENLRAQEADQEAGAAMQIRYVFRGGGRTQARGMFLEDYGVVFTVQVPSLGRAYSPSITMVGPDSIETVIAGALGEEIQLRNQMSRMRAENEVMIQRFERQVATSGATSEDAQRLRTALAEMESAYNEYAANAEKLASEREQASVAAEAPSTAERRPTNRVSGLRVLSSASPEAIARAEALAVEQKNQIEGAVIEAVVDTMASYGRVIHGLEDDDRLAIVLLPSSYLNQIGSWLRATQRDEEFIISVRFRDVMELDKGDISPEEFGARIRVESRLGQPHENR